MAVTLARADSRWMLGLSGIVELSTAEALGRPSGG